MEDTREKHVLVVGGFPPPHWWMMEKGYRITWINDVDSLKNRKGYFRKIGVSPDANYDEWISLVVAVHNIDPIHHVVNCREQFQVETSMIAEKLGITWHSIRTIESCENKFKMRIMLDEDGSQPFKFAKVKNLTELESLYERWNVPIVVKPLNSSGSTGISVINNKDSIRKNWTKLNNLGFYEAIVEEYITGQEISVEAFSKDGEHKIICFTEKFKDPDTSVELGHCVPASFGKEIEDEINLYVIRTLTKLGIKDGMTHTELFITPSGPRIVETHLRMGGYIPELIKKSSGIDLVDVWMRNIIENDRMANFTFFENVYSSIWFKKSEKKGVVREIINLKEVENMEGVFQVGLLKRTGDMVHITTNSMSRLSYVMATGNTPDEATKNAKDAVEKLIYEID